MLSASRAAVARFRRYLDSWPLGRRLAFAVLIVATIAAAGLFYNLSWVNRREVEKLQTDFLVSTAQETSRQLDSLVREELSRVGNLSRSRAAREFISVRSDQRSALFTPTLDDFSNFLASDAFYRAVLLLDPRGEVLISTQGSYVGQSFAQAAFFQQALSERSAVLSDPGISSLDGQPIIWLAAPVFALTTPRAPTDEGTSAPPGGVLAVSLSLEEFWQIIERLKLGDRGYAMLVDQHGIRLAHGVDRRYVFRSLAPLPPATWAALHAEGRFANLPQIADSGSERLLAYIRLEPLPPLFVDRLGQDGEVGYYSAARMTTRPWTAVAVLPEQEVLAPADRVTLGGLGAALLLTALLGMTVWWLAQTLLRPVPRLARAADKIARGDLSTPVAVQGSRELEDLGASFETMRRSLLASRDELATWASTLEQRVAQRSQEVAALSEVISSASRTQAGHELLQTALGRALTVVGAEMGGIWLADAEGGLRLVAQEAFSAELQLALAVLRPGEGVLGQVQAQGTPIVLDDIGEAPRLARITVREAGLHAFAGVPLRIHGRNLGVMGLFSRQREGFSADAVALAAAIAQQIALTLDNMALLDQVQAQAREVATLEEREHIAAELHDSLAQTLGYLYLQMDRLVDEAPGGSHAQVQTRLAALQEIVGLATQEVRQFISQLRDVAPPPAPLGQYLRDEVGALEKELSVRVELALDGADRTPVSAPDGAEVARILGEALRNAQRHGGADTVNVTFQRHNGEAWLSIRDDGRGFDPAQPPSSDRGHFGLSVMRARAARLGGRLDIESAPGQGTRVHLTWPVGAEEHP